MTYYAVAIRPIYLSDPDEISVRLGSGRRPRAVVSALDGDAQTCLDADGRLLRLLLADSKVLRLGQRLAGLPVIGPPPPPTPANLIGYDLTARIASLFLVSTPDSAIVQRLSRPAHLDFDASGRLLAVRIPAGPTARRQPDLYRALAFLM